MRRASLVNSIGGGAERGACAQELATRSASFSTMRSERWSGSLLPSTQSAALECYSVDVVLIIVGRGPPKSSRSLSFWWKSPDLPWAGRRFRGQFVDNQPHENPMANPENLPPGFERLPSGSLRVRIRLTGRKPVIENFPLHASTAEARRRQMVDSEAWAKETRRKLLAGVHVDTDDAKGLTVGDVLKTYRDEDLAGKPSNVKKDVNRINAILRTISRPSPSCACGPPRWRGGGTS